MSHEGPPLRVEPFTVDVPDSVLSDLRARIRATRWPDQLPGIEWEQGTELEYLKALLAYWADEFDWRAQERGLNRFRQFRAEVDGIRVHFVHERARSGDGIPLILTHGWPSSFVELLALVPLLTDPRAHGIAGPAFDVVIPSLPGFGFSERPSRTGVTMKYTAGLWHRLMRGLGYARYGAQGGDFGAGVSAFMALDEPDAMLGLYLSNLEIPPYLGEGSRPLSEAEEAYVAHDDLWSERERGYNRIQSTKPQTLGYGLNDSPVGLAAWIIEKWRSWTDCRGNPDERFSRDFLLTVVTLYWATQTITPSVRYYFDNKRFGVALGPDDFIAVPTAIGVFSRQVIPMGAPPREWAERVYDVRRWTPMPRGGHFAPAEEPELLARDVAAFFGELPAASESDAVGSRMTRSRR